MDKEIIKTFTQSLNQKSSILLDLAKEAASIYNKTKDTFWKNFENIPKLYLSKFDIQKQIYHDFSNYKLHSDSKIASIQQFSEAVRDYFKALKIYKQNPKNFTGEPKPPKKDKTICPIYFKKSAIHFKNGYLFLSLSQGNKPIVIKWNKNLPIPHFAIITYNPKEGWKLSLSLIEIVKQEILDNNKVLAIDLGVKRIATTFDGINTHTYSGKEIKSLINLRNKTTSNNQIKLSKCKKHSIRYKTIKQAERRVVTRINNKIKNICHTYSSQIVEYCIKNNIGKIVFGDCASTHDSPTLGKVNNQIISQGVEQVLRKYIEDKFYRIGGESNLIQEYYTSKDCPKCNFRNIPKNRDYDCKNCNFSYDRDGVGSINIWLRFNKVSFEKLNVVGLLTRPIGCKFYNQDCLT